MSVQQRLAVAASDERSLWVRLVTLGPLSMLGPFTIDTAFPAFGRIGPPFGADTAQMQPVVTSYMLAFALMSPFHGPISHLRHRPGAGARKFARRATQVHESANVRVATDPT